MATEDLIKAIYGMEMVYKSGITPDLFEHRLIEILGDLPVRESQILQLRFALFGNEKHTLKELAEQYGVTRERIRQLERQGLTRLRHLRIRGDLRPYFD